MHFFHVSSCTEQRAFIWSKLMFSIRKNIQPYFNMNILCFNNLVPFLLSKFCYCRCWCYRSVAETWSVQRLCDLYVWISHVVEVNITLVEMLHDSGTRSSASSSVFIWIVPLFAQHHERYRFCFWQVLTGNLDYPHLTSLGVVFLSAGWVWVSAHLCLLVSKSLCFLLSVRSSRSFVLSFNVSWVPFVSV